MAEPSRRGNLSQTPFARPPGRDREGRTDGRPRRPNPGRRETLHLRDRRPHRRPGRRPGRGLPPVAPHLRGGRPHQPGPRRGPRPAERPVRRQDDRRDRAPDARRGCGRSSRATCGRRRTPSSTSTRPNSSSRPARAPAGQAYVRNISVPGLVLEGVRRMTNEGLFARHLPADPETVQSLDPSLLDGLQLAPHEAYLLDLLAVAEVPGRPAGRERARRARNPAAPVRLSHPGAGRQPRSEAEDGPAPGRDVPGRHGQGLRRLQRQVFLHLQVHLQGDRPGRPERHRQFPGGRPRPPGPGLPGPRAQGGRADRAPVLPEDEHEPRRRGQPPGPSPEHGRDPRRRGPGRQADAGLGHESALVKSLERIGEPT